MFWLTVFGASQYLGTLIAPLYGVAGDRLGHKKLLLCMRMSYAVFAVTLLAFILTGHISPLIVIAITTLMGLVRPSDLGVRGALIAESMPAGTLVAALSLSRTTQDSARVAGALAGASLVAFFGMAAAYMFIAAFYLVGALLMFGDTAQVRQVSMAMTPEELHGKSPWRDLKEGLAHTWNTPVLLALVSLAFLTNLSAFPLTNGLMPYVAKDVYHLDQTGLGYLVASFAIGSLAGSLFLSNVHPGMRLTRLMMVCSSLWYIALLIFAQMPTPWLAVPFLIMSGVDAELLDGVATDHAAARSGRALPRACDGRAHDGDLQPAARLARRRSADRLDGISGRGDAVRGNRPAVHDHHFDALAQGFMARLSCGSWLPFLGRAQAFHLRPGHAGDQPRGALERDVTPQPACGDDEPVAEADQIIDVRDAPQQPGEKAFHPEAAHLHDGALAANGGERPEIEIAERRDALALAARLQQPAGAIIHGSPDISEHPYVGLMFDDETACTGSALSPRVMLTAAHCLSQPSGDRFFVTFAPDVADTTAADYVQATGYAVTPFCGFSGTCGRGLTTFASPDVAVLVLDEPVQLPRYAKLPALGLVDTLRQKQPLTYSGYGATDVLVGGGPQQFSNDFRRTTADAVLVQTDFVIAAEFLRSTAKGKAALCFGDSGSAVLRGDTVLGVHSFANGQCSTAGYATRVDVAGIESAISAYLR